MKTVEPEEGRGGGNAENLFGERRRGEIPLLYENLYSPLKEGETSCCLNTDMEREARGRAAQELLRVRLCL